MPAGGGSDVRQLLLQVDASVALAQRNLAALSAQVAADSAKMDASLANVDGAAGRLGTAFGSITKLGVGFAASLGVDAIVGFGRDILQFADDLSASAEQAGMAVEQYQVMKQALRTLEVEGDAADKVFKSLKDAIGAVQEGTDNGATQALERLGVRAKILSGEIKDPNDLLNALAEASKNAGTEFQFTTNIVDIVGKKIGVDLAAALSVGGDAFREIQEHIKETGSVLTEEMVNRLADANESIDRFLEVSRYQFAIWAADAIESVNSVAEALARIPGMTPTQGAAYANNQLPDWVNSVFPGSAALITAGGAVAGASGDDKRARLAQTGATLSASGNAFRAIGAKPVAPPRPRPPKPPKTPGGARRTAPHARGARRAAPRADTYVLARDRIADDKMTVSDFFADSDFDYAAEAERIFGSYAEKLKETAHLTEGLHQSLAEVADDMPSLDDLLSQDAEARLRDFAADFKQDLAQGLAQAIVAGGDLGDVLVDTFKRAAAAMLESGILNFLTGGEQGTSFASMWAGLSKSFGGGGFHIPGFAAGGAPPVGRLSLVGEKGPELFVPRVPGTIIPNHALGGGGSKYFDLRGAVVTEDLIRSLDAMTDAKVLRHGPAIASAAASRLIRQLKRPGLNG